jgi:hypothetical protein
MGCKMSKLLKLIFIVVLLYVPILKAESDECISIKKMDYEQLRAYIVKASIIHYQGIIGPCPCPYSFDLVYNEPCGTNSAYSKQAIKPVKCFLNDVTFIDIANFKAQVCSTPGPVEGGQEEDKQQEERSNQ